MTWFKTPEQLASEALQRADEAARRERDKRIEEVSWRYERHARETRLGLTTTDNLADLDAYIQALADLPEAPGWPDQVTWPTEI